MFLYLSLNNILKLRQNGNIYLIEIYTTKISKYYLIKTHLG